MKNWFLGILSMCSASTPPASSVLVENLSWTEFERELPRKLPVLLPIGARLKEHGHHLPLSNDWRMAEELARRVMARTPVFALPTVPFGYYPAFVEYPGSVNLRADVFRDTVVDIVRSFARHGLKRFYALNTGISTIPPLREASEILAKEGVKLAYTDLRVAGSAAVRRLEKQARGTHADEIETSMMLELAPETVRMKLAAKDDNADRGPGGLSRDANAKGGVYSPTGAWGDPTLATKEKGRELVEALVADIVRDIQAL